MKYVLMIALVVSLFATGLLGMAVHAQTRVPSDTTKTDCALSVDGTAVPTGPELQENFLLCDGQVCVASLAPTAQDAVCDASLEAAAQNRNVVGTPLGEHASQDWAGHSIVYVEFSSGYHAEYNPGADSTQVRFYNLFNQRVF